MFLILPVAILLVTALSMWIIAQAYPRFRFHWLVASGGAALAWLLVWLLRNGLPTTLILVAWEPAELFPLSPMLLADAFSWPFALALVTLALAVILTDVGRAAEVDWAAWAGSLAITALGLLAVFAGNILALVVVWSVIDALELIILLPRRPDAEARSGIITYFSTSLMGTLIVLFADLLARVNGETLNFGVVPRDVGILLLLGVGLRLGVLPLHVPFTRSADLRRGFGTILRLVPTTASMVLLVRAGTAGGNFRFGNIVLGLLLLTAAYGVVAWARRSDELVARPYWILSMAGFAFAAVLRGQAAAALAWSLAMIFSGGVLFLLEEADRRLLVIPALGLGGVVMLPFTPAQAGSTLFGGGFNLFVLLLLPVHAILLGGYVRHMLRARQPLNIGPARWIAWIYPIGLAILPATHWVLGVFLSSGGGLWWPGLVSGALTVGVVYSVQNGVLDLPEGVFVGLDTVFSLRWVYRLGGWGYRQFGRMIRFFNVVLDGEGGLLWALLLAILLISLIVQLGRGGA
jgi:hypothetical protein